jgi:hypothetical protein
MFTKINIHKRKINIYGRRINIHQRQIRKYQGYTSANNHIIKLDIEQNSKNNLKRTVYDQNHALYRTNKARVIKIYGKINRHEKDNIESDNDPDFIYSIYRSYYIDDYEDNNKPYGKGIYFYLTEEAAHFQNFLPNTNYTGEYKQWYQDGRLYYKINYSKGKQGIFQVFFPDGSLAYQG